MGHASSLHPVRLGHDRAMEMPGQGQMSQESGGEFRVAFRRIGKSWREHGFTFITGGDTFRSMKATNWEFTNRAMVFGLIFGFTFPLYALDHQNSTAALANWLGTRLQMDADFVARLLFAFAAFLLVVAAVIRTWASSYLQASVVYAAEVKSESLVADGPYRRVRNPLYFANVLMIVAMGAMMSRLGFLVAVIAMLVFCYRLILREEAELHASQGQPYDAYCKAVPRLWPSLWPRVASAGRQANWAEGIKAESWYWGFAAALIAYAVTLKLKLFFAILAASLVLFWVSSGALQKKSNSQR
jgi:protein-S-isoprenylcysteine O-methyltransferase Ste14